VDWRCEARRGSVGRVQVRHGWIWFREVGWGRFGKVRLGLVWTGWDRHGLATADRGFTESSFPCGRERRGKALVGQAPAGLGMGWQQRTESSTRVLCDVRRGKAGSDEARHCRVGLGKAWCSVAGYGAAMQRIAGSLSLLCDAVSIKGSARCGMAWRCRDWYGKAYLT